MEEWEAAWLEGRAMPPHSFPSALMQETEDILENWFVNISGQRCQVEEWVSAEDAFVVLDGLLWSGFRLKGQAQRRVRPIPVWVRLLYRPEAPKSAADLEPILIKTFAQVFSDWRREFERHGRNLETAP